KARDRGFMDRARHKAVLEQRLDLGREHEHAATGPVVQRTQPQAIAGQQELLLAGVPQRQRKLAVCTLPSGNALLFVQVKQQIAGMLPDRVSGVAKDRSTDIVLEGVTVADHRERSVLIDEDARRGLRCSRAKKTEAERDAVSTADPLHLAVRTAGTKRLRHRVEVSADV